MRSGLKMAAQLIKVFLLFTSCTLLFYFAMLWINEEYQNYHRFEKPKGESVEEVSKLDGSVAWMNRLFFFFENGE